MAHRINRGHLWACLFEVDDFVTLLLQLQMVTSRQVGGISQLQVAGFEKW